MARFPLILLPLPFLLCACAGDSKKNAGENERMEWQSAENLQNSGDLAGAARIYENLAKTSPDPVDAEIELAAIDRKLGKADDAVMVMKDAQKRQPDNQKITSQLGFALIDAGRSEEAVGLFDSLIQKDPGNALAYSGKGVAFDKAGNHLAAQDLYQQGLKIAPDSLSIENNLAMSLILNNQLEQAIAILDKLSGRYPDNKIVRHNLALAYGLNGENEKALKLNLKDLPPDQARENEKFYHYYAHLREKFTASGASGMQIGFSETPANDKKEALKIAKKHPHVARKASPEPSDHDTPPVDDADAGTPAPAAKAEPEPDAPAIAAIAPAANFPSTPPAVLGTVLPTSGDTAQNNDFPSQHTR